MESGIKVVHCKAPTEWGGLRKWSLEETCAFMKGELGLADDSGLRAGNIDGPELYKWIRHRNWTGKMMQPVYEVSLPFDCRGCDG